jgi:hypothetical protein
MEAFPNDGFVADLNRERALPPCGGYLGQPEMRAFVEDALALGWTLIAYETRDARSPFSPDGGVDRSLVNQREEDQARNLLAALPDTPLLVWCGNSHLSKAASADWVPMGHVFMTLSGIKQFSLDQTVSIFDELGRVDALRDELERHGGTARMLSEELPEAFCGAPGIDAYLFSLDNELV